jgi:nucleotide-binding universal stress UspA family protein
MKLHCSSQKILLPVDGSEHSMRAVHFAGHLGKALGTGLQEISLLSVLTGRYMRRRVPYVDYRSEILKLSGTFAKFRQRHVNQDIKPALDRGEEMLRAIGIETRIEKLIVDGDPAQEIVRIANKGKYTAIILARRGLSGIIGILVGSITNKVVHSAVGQTIYVVGQKVRKDKQCPVSKILVPVDGSPYALKGVEHAACMVRALKKNIKKVELLRVINLAFYEQRLMEGVDLEEETKAIFEEAQSVLLEAGISKKLISTHVRIGGPAEEIMKQAEKENFNLIIMGRRGRTALKDFILGGISTTVLQRCQNITVAIVSNK